MGDKMKLYQHKLYPGYFIDLVKKEVYSIKSGMLKALKPKKFFTPYYMYNKNGKHKIGDICWSLSHEGMVRTLFKSELKKYADIDGEQTDLVICVKKK